MATSGCQVQRRLAITVLEYGTRPPAHQQLHNLLVPMHHLEQTTVLPTHTLLACDFNYIIKVTPTYSSEERRMLILVNEIRVGTILQQQHYALTVTC
jgi:hypothetical protein